ncbi:hypothetical protein [Haliangium sp.]|uniref:hypothetical protein n=1 Tax=Haliangium sp. TaxID=2663208 RepID=UPI003D11B52F
MRFFSPINQVTIALLGALVIVGSPAFADEPSLAQQLRSGADGQPVLLVNRPSHGVIARTPDGHMSQVIASNAWATHYDPALELLWLFRDGTLGVLDLRLPRPKLVPIVDGLGALAIPVVRSRKSLVPGVHLLWAHKPSLVVVKFTAASLWPLDEAKPEEVAEANAELAATARGARIVGEAWLRSNLDRRARKTKLRSQKFTRRVRGVPRDDCRKPTCGRAARVGRSGRLWVVTGDTSDHDDSWVVCDLYDPKTRRWSYPLDVGARTWRTETTGVAGGYSCGARFDASGSVYLLGVSVCHMDEGCSELGQDLVIGWLDPGVHLSPPKPATPHPWGLD